MNLLCTFFSCRRDAAACRCRRCGRVWHDWRRVERREVRAELRGHSREGRMRYEKTYAVLDRCADCGAEKRGQVTERVDH